MFWDFSSSICRGAAFRSDAFGDVWARLIVMSHDTRTGMASQELAARAQEASGMAVAVLFAPPD
jgi:hypothetical protein